MCLPANKKNKQSARNVGTWGSDSIPIVVDSATTKTITPNFKDLINPVEYKTKLSGIGEGQITHKGKVEWEVIDDQGQKVLIEDAEAYYSPSVPFRLLCPHSWKQYMDQK